MKQVITFTDLLDPREHPDRPLREAVWIPFSELARRSYELPAKGMHVRVADCAEASATVDWLKERGWTAEITSVTWFADGALPLALWRPNDILLSLLESLPTPARAIDLGCGSGRDAIFLASKGTKVTACDHLPDALDMGRRLAARYDLSEEIEWEQTETRSKIESIADSPQLTLLHFHFHPIFLPTLARRLCPGSLVSVEGFTDVNAARNGRPSPEHWIPPPMEIPTEFEVLEHDANWRGSRHTRRYLLQRRER